MFFRRIIPWAIICGLLALIGRDVRAQEPLTVGAHALSIHGSSRYETLTPGLYVRTESGLTAGVLRNSHGRPGAYAGQTWERNGWALTVGAIAGYERAKLLPLVVPSYRFDSGLRVSLLPNPWERSGTALHFSWEWQAK